MRQGVRERVCERERERERWKGEGERVTEREEIKTGRPGRKKRAAGERQGGMAQEKWCLHVCVRVCVCVYSICTYVC